MKAKTDKVTTRQADVSKALAGDNADVIAEDLRRRKPEGTVTYPMQGSLTAALQGLGGTYEDFIYESVPDQLPADHLQTMLRGGRPAAPAVDPALTPEQALARAEREQRDRLLSEEVAETESRLSRILKSKEQS